MAGALQARPSASRWPSRCRWTASRKRRARRLRCFYTGPGQAINPELNPFKTYQTLFAGMPAPSADGMPDPAVQRLFPRRKSVLDYVAGNLTSFRSRVAAEDGKLIEQHLTSIRALEA